MAGLDPRRPYDLAALFGTALRTSLQVRKLAKKRRQQWKRYKQGF